jgi:hypothetical protein
MHSRPRMILVPLLLLLGLVWAMPASAVTVTVTLEPDGYFFLFRKISPIEGNDPVFILNRDTGEVLFGDGVLGQRPPTGEGIVAPYRQGSGASGNTYAITANFQPFLIPLCEFFEDCQVSPDLGLIVAGLTTLGVQTRPDGVMVQQAEIVPVTGSLWLVLSGLAGLITFRKWQPLAG